MSHVRGWWRSFEFCKMTGRQNPYVHVLSESRNRRFVWSFVQTNIRYVQTKWRCDTTRFSVSVKHIVTIVNRGEFSSCEIFSSVHHPSIRSSDGGGGIFFKLSLYNLLRRLLYESKSNKCLLKISRYRIFPISLSLNHHHIRIFANIKIKK